MQRRPRVTAQATADSISLQKANGQTFNPPSAHVEVDFDLHDHMSALALLEKLTEDVRRQIGETE